MHWKKIVLGGFVLPVVTLGLVACAHKRGAETAGKTVAATDPQMYPVYAGQRGQSAEKRTVSGRVVNSMNSPASQTYYFGFDQSRIKDEDMAALEIQAHYLAMHPRAKVRLEGNTDSIGSREYNVGLGWRRDQGVSSLLKQYGVRPNQINMVSYGKERPARLGGTKLARSLNRRVHMVYTAG